MTSKNTEKMFNTLRHQTHVNQRYTVIAHHLLEILPSSKQTADAKNVGAKEVLCYKQGLKISQATMEISREVPQRPKSITC